MKNRTFIMNNITLQSKYKTILQTMNKEKQELTFKEKYNLLRKSEKVKVRNAFLLKFEYEYPTWYQKLTNNNFKNVELEWLDTQLPATNQNI